MRLKGGSDVRKKNLWIFFHLCVGWGRVIPGQGNSGTVRAISDKKYFHQVKQSIWPKIIGILLADTPYMYLLLWNFGEFFGEG